MRHDAHLPGPLGRNQRQHRRRRRQSSRSRAERTARGDQSIGAAILYMQKRFRRQQRWRHRRRGRIAFTTRLHPTGSARRCCPEQRPLRRCLRRADHTRLPIRFDAAVVTLPLLRGWGRRWARRHLGENRRRRFLRRDVVVEPRDERDRARCTEILEDRGISRHGRTLRPRIEIGFPPCHARFLFECT